MMTPETPIPVFQSPDATAPVPAPVGCNETTMPVPVVNATAQTPVLPPEETRYCNKVKREIRRYGVDRAMARWRVMCDYMQTEDWWPAVARAVELVFDNAYEERNRILEEDRKNKGPKLQLSISQKVGDTDNTFENGSNSQVFNGDVEGTFGKIE